MKVSANIAYMSGHMYYLLKSMIVSYIFSIIHLKLGKREMHGRLTKRDNFDDKPSAIEKRIETFESKTLPVVEKYKYKVTTSY